MDPATGLTLHANTAAPETDLGTASRDFEVHQQGGAGFLIHWELGASTVLAPLTEAAAPYGWTRSGRAHVDREP